MAPASAQLTLTPAQEKEDNKSQTQAAKAEIESTANKIKQNCVPPKDILIFLVCFKESIVFFFFFLFIFRFGCGGCIQLSIQGVPSSEYKIVQIPINIRSEVYTC